MWIYDAKNKYNYNIDFKKQMKAISSNIYRILNYKVISCYCDVA